MKIIFAQKVKALAGSEKYFLEFIPELEKRGISTHFLCVINNQDAERGNLFVDAYKKMNASISVKYVKSDKSIFDVLKFLKEEIDSFNPDIINTHLIHADFWLALLKRRKRFTCPLVSTKQGYDEKYISIHGFDPSYMKPNLYFRLAKFSQKHISRSYAISHGLRRLYIGAGICDENKMDLIHHGFDLPALDYKALSAERKSPNQIIIIARIIPFKGHKYLIEALPKIVKSVPDVELIILGHGDEKLIQELQDFVKEHKLESNVNFEGYKLNIYDYLLGSDIMIVPSIAEGFGLIFLEALNAKLPIVGFDVPATNEIVVDGETGFLVKPYNTDDLANCIITLLNDKEKRKVFGEKGHERLKLEFSLKKMVNLTLQFYQNVLDSENEL